MTHRIVTSGPGFTEPVPSDAFGRWRPVLDRLSPEDRETAMIELAFLRYNRRAQARIVARYAQRIEGGYLDAAYEAE